MIEIKPILFSIQPWDATKGTSVYYTYTGSKQSLENQLVITDKESKLIVYSFEFSTFEKVHHIPPKVLSNGKSYTAKIRVKTSDGQYSPYSMDVEFKTLKTPVLDISNIDGQGYVYNSDITFVADYSQDNGELVKTYRFSLYDENEDLIDEYPLRNPVVTTPNVLTETIKGLEKGKGYFIQCSVETYSGLTYTHRERFIPLYIVPSINGVISTRNDEEEGFIRITANLKQILGTQIKSGQKDSIEDTDATVETQLRDNYDYIDNEWVVITPEKPLMFKGLGMNRASDFVMKVWCRDIPDETKFIELSPVDDTGIAIQLWKKKDRIIAVKEYEGMTSRYVSNIVTVPKGVPYMIYMKVIEHRIDLEVIIL
ncbi:hypothetical protein [Bacillus pumilus]|uniref:hypothetical protein n=1 Tax=Bacillus pumilus TaxID=1408 RepID=UPI0021B48CB0|nr:hypothetical protein [Bacillus pumilus]